MNRMKVALVLLALVGIAAQVPLAGAPAAANAVPVRVSVRSTTQARVDKITKLATGVHLMDTACHERCDGKNPESYGVEDENGVFHRCAEDGASVRSLSLDHGLGWVQLRYSNRCRAAWARGGVNNEIIVRSYFPNGKLRRVESTFVGNTPLFTLMVNDAGLLAEACLTVQFSDAVPCTSRY